MIEIRPLRRSDIDALQRIDMASHDEAWSHNAFVAQIDNPKVRHLVAASPTEGILGHAGLWSDGPVLRITNVAVGDAARGRGVATALLVELLREPREGERLELEVRPANRSAQRLYSRFGFAPVGVARNFYDRRDSTGSRDALVMAVTDPHDPAWRARIADIEANHLGKGAAA